MDSLILPTYYNAALTVILGEESESPPPPKMLEVPHCRGIAFIVKGEDSKCVPVVEQGWTCVGQYGFHHTCGPKNLHKEVWFCTCPTYFNPTIYHYYAETAETLNFREETGLIYCPGCMKHG